MARRDRARIAVFAAALLVGCGTSTPYRIVTRSNPSALANAGTAQVRNDFSALALGPIATAALRGTSRQQLEMQMNVAVRSGFESGVEGTARVVDGAPVTMWVRYTDLEYGNVRLLGRVVTVNARCEFEVAGRITDVLETNKILSVAFKRADAGDAARAVGRACAAFYANRRR